MNILQVTEKLLDKVKRLFGDIEHSIERGFCRYEGIYHKIEFLHPKEEIQISLIVYNKNNICIFTPKNGIKCFHDESIEKIENELNNMVEKL